MPPTVALLLCIAFVLFLLWVEGRSSRSVSVSLWIPTLWMLMIASRSLGEWFRTGSNESGNALDQIVLSIVTIAGMVVLARRRINWSRTLYRQKWLVALLAYMFISTFWSDITLIALRRWVREVIVLVMALVITSECNPRQALTSVLRRSAYILIPFSLVLIKYYPAVGRAYGRWSGIEMWTGVTGQKNMLGRLCMISIFFLGWGLYQHWRKGTQMRGYYPVWADLAVILIAAYLLIRSDSSTSVASLLVGIATFWCLRLSRKLKVAVPQSLLLAVAVFLMAFGLLAPFMGGENVATFSSSLGRDETLTGRTEVWAAVLPAMRQQPIFGYGFGSFWTDARRELYEIPTAHNGYLDILLELGTVGIAFYVLWLLSCARQFHRALVRDYDWASLAICFLLIGLIYNTTESALNSLTEHMTAVVTMLSFVVPPLTSPHISTVPVRGTLKRHLRDSEITVLEMS